MAVVSSTASATPRPGPSSRAPVRTCIGCRNRGAATELLRVVVAPDATGKDAAADRGSSVELGGGPAESPALPVVPDPRRRMAGRGAWLHPDQRCVELAVRRRAFARALRVSGPVDPEPVCAYIAQLDSVEPTRRNPAGDEKSMGTR